MTNRVSSNRFTDHYSHDGYTTSGSWQVRLRYFITGEDFPIIVILAALLTVLLVVSN